MKPTQQPSYWLLQSQNTSPVTSPVISNDSLQKNRDADIAIIGGGFTGLSTAIHLLEKEPSLSVVLIESESIGMGASGRNAGFSMTLFGLSLELTALRFGKDNAAFAHRYMVDAVNHLESLVTKHNIDCDYERNGFLKVATYPDYVKRLEKEFQLIQSLGLKGFSWLSKNEIQKQVYSSNYHAAIFEECCAILDPVKLAFGLKKAAQNLGAKIYEHTAATAIEKKNKKYIIQTPSGRICSDQLVFATNAYSHLLKSLKYKQVPGFTRIVLTEPLGNLLNEIGWKKRQGIEDSRNLIHYYRLTHDNRLLMGGGDVGITFGDCMNHYDSSKHFHQIHEHIVEIFPALKNAKITHTWGGPVSVTLDLAPALGFLGNDRTAVYSVGCIGHGVSMSNYNGLTLSELLLNESSQRTETFFVNRFTLPWPPEPVRFALSHAIRGYMKIEDTWFERSAQV